MTIKHRIFIALDISEKLKKIILNWENGFTLEHPEVSSQIRWLSPENLHITLVPPWYESDEGVEKVKELLRSVDLEFFYLEFMRISYGPNSKQPRLVWVEGQTSRGLANLKDDVFTVLKKKPESKPFRLHITIARFRPERFSSFSIKRIDEKFAFREEVTSILLMESHLSRTGSEYVILDKISL